MDEDLRLENEALKKRLAELESEKSSTEAEVLPFAEGDTPPRGQRRKL